MTGYVIQELHNHDTIMMLDPHHLGI